MPFPDQSLPGLDPGSVVQHPESMNSVPWIADRSPQ